MAHRYEAAAEREINRVMREFRRVESEAHARLEELVGQPQKPEELGSFRAETEPQPEELGSFRAEAPTEEPEPVEPESLPACPVVSAPSAPSKPVDPSFNHSGDGPQSVAMHLRGLA